MKIIKVEIAPKIDGLKITYEHNMEVKCITISAVDIVNNYIAVHSGDISKKHQGT